MNYWEKVSPFQGYSDSKSLRERIILSESKSSNELNHNRGIGEEEYFEEFALKVQDLENPEHEGMVDTVKREMDVITALEHPFIVDMVSSYETEAESQMLMTMVEGGELWNVIHREEEDGNWISGIGEDHAKFYALVIADTLAYMHHKNIIFRDLKPENILIDADGKLD